MNRPASLVVVVRVSFVEGSTRVTVAPATAAPDGSVTAPATVPVEADWENKPDGVKANRQHRATTTKTRLLSMQLPPGWAMPGPAELGDTPTCELPKATKGRILEDAIDQKSTHKLELARRRANSVPPLLQQLNSKL